ncbi:hypothetical protein HYX08_01100 [Candidatus Woesearchaeota archaeon]|nr:hypothetical protein [Candidatus Woesearchaeota archaeon]
MSGSWSVKLRAGLSALVSRTPETYESVAADVLDTDLLKDGKNAELVSKLSGCLDSVVVGIATEAHRYQVHSTPRTTIEFYGIDPIDSDEYAYILQIVEAAAQGNAFGQLTGIRFGNHDMTRRHIDLQQKLTLSRIVDIIRVYDRMMTEMEDSPNKPIKSISLGNARFSNVKPDLYDRAMEAGFKLEKL